MLNHRQNYVVLNAVKIKVLKALWTSSVQCYWERYTKYQSNQSKFESMKINRGTWKNCWGIGGLINGNSADKTKNRTTSI